MKAQAKLVDYTRTIRSYLFFEVQLLGSPYHYVLQPFVISVAHGRKSRSKPIVIFSSNRSVSSKTGLQIRFSIFVEIKIDLVML